MFYAETQNKILFAITGKNAAEIVVARADENKPNMALTNWKGAIVRKQDIYIAKNYLTEDKIDSLNRFIMVFLETAELRAKNRKDITMNFWRENIDKILELYDKIILNGKGNISNAKMEQIVQEKFQLFVEKRKIQEAINADEDDIKELNELETLIKSIDNKFNKKQ